ncbi:MAG TPA: fasciclin domain-containing protein [Gillisia sp.]|nr:fasciclin domain-containing protein [Gillisia sp.]
MLKISYLKKIALTAFLSFSVIACSSDDEGGDVIVPDNTIADFVETNQDYSSLNAALIATDLKGTLDGTTNYTVFAPNNAAFNAFLSANGFENLNAVPVGLLTQVLLNHVIQGEVYSADLETGYATTLATGPSSEANLSMFIDTEDGVMINGQSTVTNADVEVDNGVIHAVNTVIGLPDITTFATADPTFENLVAALTRDEDFTFVPVLQTQESPAPFTVFAPTNEAFVDLLEELDMGSLDDIPSDVLAAALSYHVVTGANVRSGDITDGMEVETFESGMFTINANGDVTITDENGRMATVVAVDVQATNGVIHVIDTVLLPGDGSEPAPSSNTIADFVENNADYSSLNAALEVAGLKETLAGNAELTVFAPNNAAFEAFLSDNGFADLGAVPVDVLTQVLLNHVQSGSIYAADLTTGYIESMASWGASDENLSMYINTADGVMINGVSSVTTPNVEVDNGVIHAVDAVIGLPDVVTFATADPNFEILVEALTRDEDFNFVSTLQTQGAPAPFTVFAPTNDAFVDFLGELEFASLEAIPSDVLSSTLSYHVVTGANVRSTDITDGMEVTTFETGTFTINAGESVTITDENERESTVIAVDVQATNGVIHVIDTVLLPEL